jgi:hypothetical protein
MKKPLKSLLGICAFFLFAFLIARPQEVKAYGYQPVYRLYNAGNGEHLYTADTNEVKTLSGLGWSNEGICWYGADGGNAIYRFYLRAGDSHLYTNDPVEIANIKQYGWVQDGVVNGNATPIFYSLPDDVANSGIKTINIYRLVNNVNGLHLLSASAEECNGLASMPLDPSYNRLLGIKATTVWSNEGVKVIGRGLGTGNNGDNTTVPATIEPSDGKTTGVTIENEQIGFERAIEADVTLNGTGTGSHAKLVLLYGSLQACSFGMQYDTAAGSPYNGTTQFMVENIYDNVAGSGHQYYYRCGETLLGSTHRIMIGYDADSGYVYCYVDGILTLRAYNPGLAQGVSYNPSAAQGGTNYPLDCSLEASGRKDGDTFDASFKNVKTKYSGGFSSDAKWCWTTSNSNNIISTSMNYNGTTQTTGTSSDATINHGQSTLPYVTCNGTLNVDISGTISGLNGGDWDSNYNAVSGKINFHDYNSYSN